MENEWGMVKEKVASMSRAMWKLENEEARKAYDNILIFMIICEQEWEKNGKSKFVSLRKSRRNL